jgi:fermentation-respiration switch protein FrsA (DUF1100 family)
MLRKITILLLVVGLALAAAPDFTAAQDGADGWTAYELNLRAGPGGGYAVITVLPVNTGLLFEARDPAMDWLLGHTTDGAWRGWVASGYLRYRDGFTAARLPVSEEIVPADSSGGGGDAGNGDAPPASGIIAQELVYDTGHSQYYRISYMSDGLRVNGWLGYPTTGPDRMPAIIYNRGGAWNTGALIGIEIVPLVESGYVAIASQYRGNAGSEGAEQFGWDEVRDVLNLVPVLRSLPFVDGARIGMMGGSRGGMVTYMALKEETMRGTNAIKAAVTVGGLADLFMWAEERPKIVEDVYLPLIGVRPSESFFHYEMRSATYWPELITTPLLILHGEADTEISVAQSVKLYEALKNAGQPATLITYPGDNHQLSGQLGGYPPALAFFARYLGGDGVDRQHATHWPEIDAVSQWFWRNMR